MARKSTKPRMPQVDDTLVIGDVKYNVYNLRDFDILMKDYDVCRNHCPVNEECPVRYTKNLCLNEIREEL